MVQFVVLQKDHIREATRNGWRQDVESDAILADGLRAELWARTTVTRRPLCRRIVELLEPACPVELETAKRVLHEMERAGDVTVGERGLLAAAPLRAVDLGGGNFLLVGGPESSRLRQLLGCDVGVRATSRTVDVEEDDTRLRQTISAAGGTVLTPGQWAGLDRVLPAGAEWLQALDVELHHNPRPPEVLPAECGEWRYYEPSSDDSGESSLWSKVKGQSRGQLWRARNDHGYWVHVWTDGTHPESTNHIGLYSDDSHRTKFSLDRDIGKTGSMSFYVEKNTIRLQVGTMLPLAEYRFLLTLGDREFEDGLAYRFPTESWPQVTSMLEVRLGVVPERCEPT